MNRVLKNNNPFKIRALKNNNPFNIRKSDYPFLGKKESSDPEFETFVDGDYGCRAGLKILLYYVSKGIDTPFQIIARFSKRSGVALENYVDFVVRNYRGIAFMRSDEHIPDLNTLCFIASRIVQYECCLSSSELARLGMSRCYMLQYVSLFNLNERNIL